MCHTDIEDEYNFILSCPLLQTTRKSYFDNINNIYPASWIIQTNLILWSQAKIMTWMPFVYLLYKNCIMKGVIYVIMGW